MSSFLISSFLSSKLARSTIGGPAQLIFASVLMQGVRVDRKSQDLLDSYKNAGAGSEFDSIGMLGLKSRAK